MQFHHHNGEDDFPHGAGASEPGWYVYRNEGEPDGPYDTRAEALYETIRLVIREAGGIIRAEDISALVGCSRRSVYRVVRMLRQANEPLACEAGVGYLWRKRG